MVLVWANYLPLKHHPQPQPSLQTLKIMLAKVEKMSSNFSDTLRALPREILFGDLFSGTGSCAVVTKDAD